MKDVRGYSIVEVSIVVLILSLLITGVAIGQSFVEQSILRSIVTDINRFNSAIDGFRDVYNYYPGDYPNAFRRWGAGNPVCTNTSGTNTSCNGNGNGAIEFASGTTAPVEDLLVWRHLANGEFINGSYTGAADGGISRYLEEHNTPYSSMEQGAYAFLDLTSAIYGDLGKVIHFGRIKAVLSSIPGDAMLTASQAYFIDNVLDDGLASSGKIFAIRADDAGSGCVDNPVAMVPRYDFSNTDITCRITFFYNKK